ncbi:MAG TPA: YdcF family protein [Rhodanobacteraceae bacterium]|nr:YdcF family protein [Rhodanobacteraceae bacterium]
MNLDWLHPLSWPSVQAGIVGAIGLLSLALRRYRTGAFLVLLGAAWLWLCATPAFATWLHHGLQDGYPPRAAHVYPKAQAIVVLGGSDLLRSSGHPRAHRRSAPPSRPGFGLALYHAQRAPIVLLSGGGGAALKMATTLRRDGVPPDALQTETRSGNTHQNALYSAAILRREHKHRILLVTSAMDMPRAAASFERQGLTVIPAPVPYDPEWLGETRHDWWPQHRALYLTSRCLHEIVGLWVYELLGWA